MHMALLLALLLAAPAKEPARALAERVHAYYAKTRDFSASFRQHYTYLAIGRTEDSEGTVQVKKPGRVRWDYVKPDRRTLFIDGKTLWIWRPDDQDGQVLASVVTNPQGDVNQIVFSEAKVDQGLADSLFQFAPPKGAYVQEF